MTRYFFDIFDGDHWTRDDTGVDCRNDSEARRQAVLALTEMAHEYFPHETELMEIAIDVRASLTLRFRTRLCVTAVPAEDPELLPAESAAV